MGKSAFVRNFLDSQVLNFYYVDLRCIECEEVVFGLLRERLPSKLIVEGVDSIDNRLSEISGVVIFDNVDSLIDVIANWAEGWSRFEHVKFIFTSRMRLGIGHEALLELKPFSLPDGVDDCDTNNAYLLFTEEVRLTIPQYEPDQREKKDIIALLIQLDGIPLAIKNAAFQMRVSSVREMLRQLRNSSDESLTATSLHISLEEELEFEWEKLSSSEQKTLAFTSIHLEEFDSGSLLELLFKWGDIPTKVALKTIGTLRDKSLLVQNESGQLYSYKITQRFGSKKLAEMGNLETAKITLIRHYSALAFGLAKALDFGKQSGILNLERLLGGFSTALIYLKAEEASSEFILARLRVSRALGKLAINQQDTVQIRKIVSREKRFSEKMLTSAQIEIQNDAALALLNSGFLEPNAACLNLDAICTKLESYELSTEIEARVVRARARIAQNENQWKKSIELCQKAQTLLKGEGLDALAAAEETTIGIAYFQLGNYSRAREHYERSVYALDRLDADFLVLFALYNLLILYVTMNENQRASNIAGRLIDGFQNVGNTFGIAQVRLCLGVIHLHKDQLEDAEKMFKSAAGLLEATHHLPYAAHAHCALAETALRKGDEKRAYEHLEISESFTPQNDPHGARIEMCILRSISHERRMDWMGVLFEMDQAINNPVIVNLPMQHLLCLARKSVALFCLGRKEEAGKSFEKCRKVSSSIPRTPKLEAVLFLEIILDLEREDLWMNTKGKLLIFLRGGFGEVSIFPISVNGWIRESIRTIWKILNDNQRYELESEVLDPASKAICLSPSFSRLRIPGGKWLDIDKHRNGKKLLRLLVENYPEGAKEDFLIRQIWPGEKIQPAAAANRLYNAVALLRGLGLKRYIRKTEKRGYFLDDSIGLVLLRRRDLNEI